MPAGSGTPRPARMQPRGRRFGHVRPLAADTKIPTATPARRRLSGLQKAGPAVVEHPDPMARRYELQRARHAYLTGRLAFLASGLIPSAPRPKESHTMAITYSQPAITATTLKVQIPGDLAPGARAVRRHRPAPELGMSRDILLRDTLPAGRRSSRGSPRTAANRRRRICAQSCGGWSRSPQRSRRWRDGDRSATIHRGGAHPAVQAVEQERLVADAERAMSALADALPASDNLRTAVGHMADALALRRSRQELDAVFAKRKPPWRSEHTEGGA